MITGPHTGITVTLTLITLSHVIVVVWGAYRLKKANNAVSTLRTRVSALERFLNYVDGEYESDT